MTARESGSVIAAGAPARAALRCAAGLDARARALATAESRARDEVGQAWAAHREALIRRDLQAITIGRIRDVAGGRLRVTALEAAGYRNVLDVLDVLDASRDRLEALPGVGAVTAAQMHAAAAQLAAAVTESLRPRIEIVPDDPVATRLVLALHRLDRVRLALHPVRREIEAITGSVAQLVQDARPARWRIRLTLSRRPRRARAEAALAAVQPWLDWAERGEITTRLEAALAEAGAPPPAPLEAWAGFERRGGEYYAVLSTVVDVRTDVPASEGFLPDDIVGRIREQSLDDSLLRATLRGYQAFGARYALVQRRVILGDEMGLGKTVQAVAVLAHLAAQAVRAERVHRVLVVCPASVLVSSSTPMENRVEEFRELVRLARPRFADSVDVLNGAAGPDAFRRAVSPVYLRRNAADVLTELPDLVQVDEWEKLSPDDQAAFRRAVFSGNFMRVRRAAFAVGDPDAAPSWNAWSNSSRRPGTAG